ncbi:MAG: hypothetical protein GX434_14285 [Peptococcaceae bacterium]|nr:hypothetical protein [Peptococcaceae bacterium]
MISRTTANNCIEKHPIIWLNTNSCGGDTISLLNSTNPDYQEMINKLFNIVYNTPTMSAEGDLANKILDSFNPSGAKPVQAVLNRKVINVPGCPINPDLFLDTLTHVIRFGEPELDQFNRPKKFFSDTNENKEIGERLLYV